MANITCAISGLRFKIAGLEGISIPASTGYYHPVFTLSHKKLYALYYQHTRNKLTPVDSYLLFCAFLQATGQVEWNSPATCNPSEMRTTKLVQNNLAQLILVYQKTSIIKHPSFKQPNFVVSYDNGKLDQVHNWIAAWQQNLVDFNVSRATYAQQRDLYKIESLLDEKLSQGIPPDQLPAIVASWASQAAEFPYDKDESYQQVIRSCFNSAKMFKTPLNLIREVQQYCYANIEPDSIHFFTLSETLKKGAALHLDYLGGSNLALGYTMLDIDSIQLTSEQKTGELKTAAALTTIVNNAPTEPPVAIDYPNKLDFLKARLAYKVATTLTAPTIKSNPEDEL